MSRSPHASAAAAGSAHLLRRQLLTDAPAVVVVAAIVLACSALVSAVPRLLDVLQTDGARAAVARTGPLQRDLAAVAFTPPPLQDGDAPFAPTRTLLGQTRADLPGPVRARVGTPTFAVDFRDLRVREVVPAVDAPADTAFLELSVSADVEEHVRYVAGRPPRSMQLTEREDPLTGDEGRVLPLAVTAAGLAEVAVAAPTAEALGLDVGSRVRLDEVDLTLDVVGVFEPLDARDPYWGFDTRVLNPQQGYSSTLGVVYTGVALVGEGAYPRLEALLAGVRSPVTLLRFPTGPEGLEAAEVAGLVRALRQVEGTTVVAPPREGWPPGSGAALQLTTDLDDVLADHLRQRAASAALVSLVVSGLLGVAVAVLALAGRLVVERRRRSLSLAAARGASPAQLRVLLAVEGLLLGVPAAVAGWAAVALVVPGAAGTWGVLLPAVLGLTPAVVLPLVARPGGVRSVRRDVAAPRERRLRAAGEALVVVVAVVALAALRRRGLAAGAQDAGVDPLLAAAPLLVALAGALVLARLYPRPLAALTRVLARRPGAVAFIGAARAGRDASGGALPLVVLLLGLSTAVFGTVVTATTGRGADLAAATTVGADARISGLGFDDAEIAAAAGVDGVEAVAGLAELAVPASTGTRTREVTLVAADAAALADVQAGVPGAPAYPPGLWQPGDRVPVVVGSGWLGVGDELVLGEGSDAVEAVVVGVGDDDLPSLRTARPWVVADRELLLAAGGDAPVYSTALLDLADDVDPVSDADRLTADLQAAMGTASPLLTRQGAVDRAREAPLVAGTLGAFPVAAVVAAGLSALAVVLALVVTAPARGRLLSRLRTLGLSPRQAQALAVWEVAPLAVTSLVAGVLLGLGVPAVVAPAVDLRAFTGGSGAPPYTVDPVAVAAVAAGFVGFVAAAVAGTVAANRRLRLGAVLRVGEES